MDRKMHVLVEILWFKPINKYQVLQYYNNCSMGYMYSVQENQYTGI